MILALDLGTNTGWAVGNANGLVTSGVQSFKPSRYEGGGMRYLRFKGWLADIKNNCGSIDAIYFEEVRRHAATDAAHVYGGLLAILTSWCEHHHIPYQGIPVGTIKKFATGKGNANKEQVVEAAHQWATGPIFDDNEADAICLLTLVLRGQA